MDLETVLPQIVAENQAFQPPAAIVTWQQPLHPVYAHDALLTQCIWNLLSNAVKFVPRGAQPAVRIWTEARNGNVRLWFQDNGIGIEPQYITKIFGMFEKLHPEADYPGTGIGLAIVRKATERMGGTMGVESEFGKGSRFWIQLKAALPN